MNIKNKIPFRDQITLNTFFIHNSLAFFIEKTAEDMRSARAVQQNNYHCDHDQSERVSSKGVGSRLEKLLNTNFIINVFQDFQSHFQKNYILEHTLAERLFLVEHISTKLS